MIEIFLKTNGKLISKFDEVVIRESIYTMDNAAVLEFNDKTAEALVSVKKLLQEDAAAEVLIDTTTRLKGYISQVKPFYRLKNQKQIPCLSVTVSTPAARYVNNSVGAGRTFNSQKVSDILRALCPDLELDIRNDRFLPRFVVYGYEDYDEAITRLCAKTDLLIYSGADGRLIVDEVCQNKQKIGWFKTGENIIRIDPPVINTDGVTLAGQLPLNDDNSLKDAVSIVLKEPGQKMRFFYADDISPAALAAKKSKNKRLDLETPNWFDVNNRLFQLNTWAGVADNWLGLNDTMLIHSINFYQNNVFSAEIGLEV